MGHIKLFVIILYHRNRLINLNIVKVLILQIIFWYKNIQSWRKSYKMVQYLPLQGANYLQNYPLSDLHVLMAIINQNDQARKVQPIPYIQFDYLDLPSRWLLKSSSKEPYPIYCPVYLVYSGGPFFAPLFTGSPFFTVFARPKKQKNRDTHGFQKEK